MLKSTKRILPVVLLAILAIGCGSGDGLTGSTRTSLDDIPFNLEHNVGSSLAFYYSGSTKPGVGRIPVIYFDYKETGRTLLNDKKAVITGEFIFSLESQEPKRGSLATYFELLNDRWVLGAPFEVLEGEVSSVQLRAEILDQISSNPLEGATVVANRPGDDPRSSLPGTTDAQGVVQLEVFQGVFEIAVSHPGFKGVVIPEFNTAELPLTPIQLKRLSAAPIGI